MTSLLEAAQKLLARTEAQYTHRGMGEYACNCCGAVANDDSHDDFVHFHREPHSPSCPWRLLAEAVDAQILNENATLAPSDATPNPEVR